MPAAHRLGDLCTGHDCHPARASDVACTTVIVNGKGVVGATSAGKGHYPVHCCPPPVTACHDSILAAGSGTVFVEGVPAGRVGDPLSCGGTAAQGSGDVFIGG